MGGAMTTSALPGDAPGLRLRGGLRSGASLRLGASWGVVGLSTACWVAVIVVASPPDPWRLAPWMVTYAVTIAVAAVVLARRPHHPLASWLALGTLVVVHELAIWSLRGSLVADASGATTALWNLLQESFYLIPALAMAHILALFADGIVRHPYERLVLRLTWLVLLWPVVLLVGSGTVVVPFYVDGGPVTNPFGGALFSIDPAIGGLLQEILGPAVVLVGAVLLVIRYRRADARARRPVRWLLVPVALMAVPLVSQSVLWEAADIFVSLAWGVVVVSFALAIGLGLLQPAGLNADRVVRGTVLYGLLWTVIALVFVVIAATVGTAAGTLLPIGWAVAVAMVAAVAFQPVRTQLERLADRWVFGARTDSAQLVVGLGESLAGTYDLDALLPRIRATLEDGMGLRWARVRLLRGDDESDAPQGEQPPAFVVDIEVEGERVGIIECGQKTSGHLSAEDVAIIETFARQAGMAVRNVRLKEELAAQAELLRASRARLVSAQEQERRRIERNIHDGVQQDLVALIGLVGHTRQELERGSEAVAQELTRTQEGLRRVLADVRDLAQGIHPAVLSDRGLLSAVETLAGRHPVLVEVRADPALRGRRMSDDIEGAAYFTVAEALANTLKHGSAQRIEVDLRLQPDAICVTARDDGVGFDAERTAGRGLADLRERVAAVGGRLTVASRPGGGTTVAAEFPLVPERGRP